MSLINSTQLYKVHVDLINSAMRIVIFTSNAIRHKYIANTLLRQADDGIVVSECRPSDVPSFKKDEVLTPFQEHFQLRYKAEKQFFEGNDCIEGKVLPILHKEANLKFVYSVVQKFQPDMAFVFGASIIRNRLLSLIPPGRFVNMHLGMSPYYRGSGTNFWPFVNNELQYVGSTLLHIDAGIDTGDIITHVRPDFAPDDTVHTAGCKVILKSAQMLEKLMQHVKEGNELPRIPQWHYEGEKVYKNIDFTEEVLQQYYENIEQGIVSKYVNSLDTLQQPKIISFGG